MKKIKGSKRGLTFSLDNEEKIGSHYRYLLDLKKNKIVIIADESGNMTVSRKKSGKGYKALYDIRSQKVRELVAKAEFLEIQVIGDKIIVSAHSAVKKQFVELKTGLHSITDIIGEKTGEIVLPVAACGECHQITFDEFLSHGGFGYIEDPVIRKKMEPVYDVVSLFSGAGLLDKAWVDDPHFRFVYACDFEKRVLDTYRHNIGDHIVCKDIRTVTGSEILRADVFLASPCCQAYSNSNRHNIDSEEGRLKRLLVDEVVRLAREKMPKVVLIENVPQMLTKDNGMYLEHVLDGLSEYEASVYTITDCDVGGYSIRKRAIILLSTIGKIVLPDMKMIPPNTVRMALKKVDKSWPNYGDVTVHSEQTALKMSFVPQGGNWKDIPSPYNTYKAKTHSSVMRRLEWDKPSITLSNFRKSNILHPEKNRILTVAEAAAIMGLDKTFRFIGKLSDMQQMVANGVTQAVSGFVKNAVLKQLQTANV